MHGLTGHPRISHAEGIATALDYWEFVLNAERAEGATNGGVGEERRRRGSTGGSPDTAGGRGRGSSIPRFIGGAAPCYLDIALYGQVSYYTRPHGSHNAQVRYPASPLRHCAFIAHTPPNQQLQMAFCGLSENTARAMMTRPRLLRFITDMNCHDKLSGYAHNYCSRSMNCPTFTKGNSRGVITKAELLPVVSVCFHNLVSTAPQPRRPPTCQQLRQYQRPNIALTHRPRRRPSARWGSFPNFRKPELSM